MDVALYYKLQSEPGHLLLTQNYLSAKLNQKINHSATQPPPDSSSDLGNIFLLSRVSGAFQSRCYKAYFDGLSVISSKNLDREQ